LNTADTRVDPTAAGSISTAAVDPAQRPPGQRQQAVVGADQARALRRRNRDRPAARPDARVDDRQPDRVRAGVDHPVGEHHGPRVDIVGRHAVGQVDDVRLGRDPGDDEVAHAHELVAQAQVGHEHHGSAHRNLRSLVDVARDAVGGTPVGLA
jgi:hypothetical protein